MELYADTSKIYKRSINIISNENYIHANPIFRKFSNKENGLEPKNQSSEFDVDILVKYFKKSMAGPPNPHLFQEILTLYILFYICTRPVKCVNLYLSTRKKDEIL